MYYIGSGNNDFALITDFNIVEDQINVGNNQVIYTETTLNELGLGVAISSQNGDLVAFVQGANINQFITDSNPVEPPPTIDEVIPRQSDEPQLPPTPTPTPDTITPTPPPTPTPNTAPVADNDNYNTSFESAIIVDAVSGILNGDSDGNGDPLIPILINPPVNGSLNLNTDGSFSYTPNVGFSGVDSFIYVANDGESNSNVATVTINVAEPPPPTPTPTPNTPPEADNDDYNTEFQSPLTVDASVGVLNGDSGANGEALTAILVNSPANGSLNLNPDGSFSYTPNGGFSGVDSFIYVANDGKDNSDIATVTINVEPPPPPPPTPTPTPNTPPVADNDNYNTAFQSPMTVDAVSGILNGDSDADGDAITAVLVNSPANGSLNLNGDGSFSYTPNAGFSGVDSFIYVANDGKDNSNIATVTIAVEPPLPTPTPTPNTPPIADNDNYNTAFQSPLTIDAVSGILNGDSDGDGDAVSAILINPPANGNLNLNLDGSFSYTPNSGFSGVDSFIYVANDGELNSDVATVTIAVEPPLPTPTPEPPTPTPTPTPTPNTPPVADNDNYNTDFESPITVDAVSGVLNGDSDANGDAITAVLVNSPANGSLNLNGDGSFSYTPNGGFSGVDSFIYVANDGKDNSDVATVTIAVEVAPPEPPEPINTPPIADNDNYTTGFESAIVIDAVSGILNGDSDGDGDPISPILVNSPANGSLNLNGDGSFSYTPNAGFSGVDSFIYVANDGELNSDVATVTIEVDVPPPPPPPNTPPFADNDSYTTGFESSITVDASVGVLNGDSDAEGEAISAILVNPPANGSLNYFNADGSFGYTPNAGFSGVDSFIYVANDGELNSDVATVTIDVGEPQPVEQTRTLNGYSQRATDDENISSTFLLTNKGNDGQTIYDRTIDTNEDGIIDDNEVDTNPNLGFFPKAIQNFIKYNPVILVPDPLDPIDFDGNTELEDGVILSFEEKGKGKPIFPETDNQPEFIQIPVVDLRAKRVIGQENIIAELGLTDEFELVYFDESGSFSDLTVKLEFNKEENIIEVIDNNNNRAELYSFPEEIIIYEFLEEKEDGTREIIDEFIVRHYDIKEISSLALATNSLEYIKDENLLSYTYSKSTAISIFLWNYLSSLNEIFFEEFEFYTEFYFKESDDFNNLRIEEPIEETILVQPDTV